MTQRFDASLNCDHATLLSRVVGQMQAGVPYTPSPDDLNALGDLAGAINYWAQQPGACGSPPNVLVEPEIQAQDYDRKTFAPSPPNQIVAFPFRIPHGPFPGPNGPLMYMSAAEFGGSPWLRRLSVSAQPGDMSGSHTSDGKQVTVYLKAGIDYPEGTLLYANLQITDAGAQPGTTGSGFSIVWPQQ